MRVGALCCIPHVTYSIQTLIGIRGGLCECDDFRRCDCYIFFYPMCTLISLGWWGFQINGCVYFQFTEFWPKKSARLHILISIFQGS